MADVMATWQSHHLLEQFDGRLLEIASGYALAMT
jgi:hypothetical protein